MSSKQNKAAAIREFMAANPGAKAKDIAAGVGCDITYVYLVQSSDRRKKKKVKPTRGQEVVRQVINADSDKIEKLETEWRKMHGEIARLHTIIDYLERKVRGASV
jgi:predicted RNase H-like nuclease (RuvC/YqgF family)